MVYTVLTLLYIMFDVAITLLGKSYRTSFANNRNFNLTGIGHFVLYPCGYLTTQLLTFGIVHLICTNDDT